MKLNPFSKKTTTGYYERIRVEFSEAKQQLEEAQAAANEAKADAETKRQYAFELEQRGNQHSISEQERRAQIAASAAQNRAGDLERKLSPLKTKLSDLRHILEGPDKLASARTAILELRRRRNALQADREQHRHDPDQQGIGPILPRHVDLPASHRRLLHARWARPADKPRRTGLHHRFASCADDGPRPCP